MKNLNTLSIYGLSESVAVCEASGLANCWAAYADNCAGDDIMGIGFNSNSGYVYIALENGISICSMLGREVEFLATDFEDGTENFFDTYRQAVAFTNLETEA